MTALVNGLSDRNVTVRKACAKSIGHLVKVRGVYLFVVVLFVCFTFLFACSQVAKPNTVSKMIAKLKSKYLEREGVHVCD